MIHQTTPFHLTDGTSLYGQSWSPEEAPRAIVLIVHGYAEHSDRYTHVATHFVQGGLKVISYDHRWHGRSPGKRAYIERFDKMVDDLEAILQQIQAGAGELPIFLYGHSMGGGVLSWFVIDRKPAVQGVVMTAPAVKVSDSISPILAKMAGFINAIAPKLKTIALDSSSISRDQKVVDDYVNDPMVYSGKTYARTGYELLRSADRIQQRMEEFALPFLIMHGTADRLTDPDGSQELYNRASSTDKHLHYYEGWFHEIHNEAEQKLVLQEALDWINERIDG